VGGGGGVHKGRRDAQGDKGEGRREKENGAERGEKREKGAVRQGERQKGMFYLRSHGA
jgi:hypothetical protein